MNSYSGDLPTSDPVWVYRSLCITRAKHKLNYPRHTQFSKQNRPEIIKFIWHHFQQEASCNRWNLKYFIRGHLNNSCYLEYLFVNFEWMKPLDFNTISFLIIRKNVQIFYTKVGKTSSVKTRIFLLGIAWFTLFMSRNLKRFQSWIQMRCARLMDTLATFGLIN